MKTIIKIARLEMKTLFSSPIAWLLMIIFTIRTSLSFINLLKGAILNQFSPFDRDVFSLELVRANITGKVFSNLFSGVIGYWYMYIPLLTMGLISRELSSGNIKLLFSSPIKISEIVWGKFIGIMLYWSLLMLILLGFVIAGDLFITRLDLPLILSCLLGVYLLAMLYSAIGLFVSALTVYQIVAAVSTFIVLGGLDYFGGLWQGYPFLRDLSWFINTTAHTNNLINGLIISRDVVYFIVLTLMFIFLSVMVLQNHVHARPLMVKIGRYLLLTSSVLLIGYLATRPKVTLYADVTAYKTNTIPVASQQQLAKIKGPVRITVFDNLFSNLKDIGKPYMVNRNIELWEPYKRFLPDLDIDYIHFYDAKDDGSYSLGPGLSMKEAAKAITKGQNPGFDEYLPPDSIHKLIDLKPYHNGTVERIMNNGKFAIIRRPPGISGATEEYLMDNFKRMMYGADTTLFLSGNGERDIDADTENDYKEMVNGDDSGTSLWETGFVNLKGKADKPLPLHVSVVVIADPMVPYSDTALKNIRDYISKGGNLLILKGPNSAGTLERITAPLGITFMPGTLVQPNADRSAYHISVKLDSTALEDTTYSIKEWNTVRLDNAGALQYRQVAPFKTLPVLVTDEHNTWNKRQESELDTGKLQFHPEQGDNHHALPVAVAVTRNINGRQQRIMIVANAGFMTRVNSPVFVHTVFRWFTYGKFPLNKLRKDPAVNEVRLSYKQADILKYFFIMLIPFILGTTGMIYLLKRKSL